MITEHQKLDLLKIEQTNNIAGYLVFFESCNKVVFFSATKLNEIKPKESLKPENGVYVGTQVAIDLMLLFNLNNGSTNPS